MRSFIGAPAESRSRLLLARTVPTTMPFLTILIDPGAAGSILKRYVPIISRVRIRKPPHEMISGSWTRILE